ncbi:hypothetical protein [Enterococcus phage Phi_Eg_SY1]|nr:hypothetical protein [Enterococcus phage Phi_Eg_SY1]
MIDEFKKQYIENLENGTGMTDELNELFNKVLEEELHGNAVLMDELIFELNDIVSQDDIIMGLQQQVETMGRIINKLATNQTS